MTDAKTNTHSADIPPDIEVSGTSSQAAILAKPKRSSVRKASPPGNAPASGDNDFNPDAVRPLIQHLLDADDPDIDDPFFKLFTQYEAYLEAERAKRANYKSSLGAESNVPMQQAQRMWDIGRLESDGDEYMMIHTKDAMRFFIGRGEDPEGKVSRIPGAKSVGTALRQFWFASGNDNPFADWALLMAEQSLDERKKSLEHRRAKALAQMEELGKQGLYFAVLRSSNPVRLELGFKSPYGFLIAHLVVVFDHFVRIIKTLQSRDLISADEARLEIRNELRPLRALFGQIQRWESLLGRPAFNKLTRADFGSTSMDVRQRIEEINEMWPGLPAEILNGTLLPRHARRNAQSASAVSGEGGLL